MYGQKDASVYKSFKNGRDNFIRNLKYASKDSAIVQLLSRQFEKDVNKLYSSIRAEKDLKLTDKDKAVRSVVYFMDELGKFLVQRKLSLYDVPSLMRTYQAVLHAVITDRLPMSLLQPLNAPGSQLIAASFTQYDEHELLEDVATYKRVASTPQFIFQFLESKPGFRFTDSLLIDAAVNDPERMVFYLQRQKTGVQDRIRRTDNIYLRQISSLSSDKNASEYLPFVTQIANKKITTGEILEQRAEARKYFQLLVNTIIATSGEENDIYVKPLRNALKQKSVAFYVNEINDLHNSADAVRFASVKGLRPQDLYYIITSAGEDLYTSSYLGLYKRLMEHFKAQKADSLFEIVGYDNYRIFLRLAANYNVLGDFLANLSSPVMQQIIHRFISNIETSGSFALDKAMDIADSYTSVAENAEITRLIHDELQANLERCRRSQHYLGIRLYGILSDIHEIVQKTGNVDKVWNRLGDYERLPLSTLENSNGSITELVLFYGDEDGIASFSNFLRQYTDKSKWTVTKNDKWVTIQSVENPSFRIFANLPLDISEELDLKAQDELLAYLNRESLAPSILVHRGHSYHLDKTLNRLTPDVHLAILGSCGGYNKAISIASINPDIQVIGSKKTGSKSINDPIINEISDNIINKRDLVWADTWNNLSERFANDKAELALFNEYFPPSKNLGLFVLKLFMYYKGR